MAEFGWSLGARRIRRRDAPSGEAALQLVDDGCDEHWAQVADKQAQSRHKASPTPLP